MLDSGQLQAQHWVDVNFFFVFQFPEILIRCDSYILERHPSHVKYATQYYKEAKDGDIPVILLSHKGRRACQGKPCLVKPWPW